MIDWNKLKGEVSTTFFVTDNAQPWEPGSANKGAIFAQSFVRSPSLDAPGSFLIQERGGDYKLQFHFSPSGISLSPPPSPSPSHAPI